VALTRLRNLDVFMRRFAEVVRLPPPDLRRCDLREVVGDLARLMRPQLDNRNITLSWEDQGADAVVQADRQQLEQALVNVLKNAMEATGEGGRIEVRIDRHQGRPRLAVRDSGPGIAPEVRDSLFTPFFSTKRDGLGIGLTVVQEILAGHGADFALDDAPGGGARFHILFRR
jgi:two-component system nitrogen regulation sensor histidine kinase NtrY